MALAWHYYSPGVRLQMRITPTYTQKRPGAGLLASSAEEAAGAPCPVLCGLYGYFEIYSARSADNVPCPPIIPGEEITAYGAKRSLSTAYVIRLRVCFASDSIAGYNHHAAPTPAKGETRRRKNGPPPCLEGARRPILHLGGGYEAGASCPFRSPKPARR